MGDGGDGFEEGGEDGVGPLDVVEEEPEEGEEEVAAFTQVWVGTWGPGHCDCACAV